MRISVEDFFMPSYRSKSEIRRIFMVHSKSIPTHEVVYRRLEEFCQKLGYTLTEYHEWSWMNPSGKSDREMDSERRMQEEGYRDFGQPGWVHMPDAHGALLESILSRSQYRMPEVNRGDLARLIEEATLLVFVEDDRQPKLTSGMNIEWDLLTDNRGRWLSVRLFSQDPERTVFPFDDARPLQAIVPIRRQSGESLDEEGLKLLELAVILSFEDIPPLIWDNRTGLTCREGREGLWTTPVTPSYRVAICPEQAVKRQALVREAVRSPRAEIRRAAMTAIDNVWSARLFWSLCDDIVSVFVSEEVDDTSRQDYLAFIDRIGSTMWDDVAARVRRNVRVGKGDH
jgi:hypothetical protein